jgi:GntR family transcriptional regulator
MPEIRKTRIPLYEAVKNWIRDHIVKYDLMTGDPLPSEREICEKLNVSRITVVRALNDLANEGVIVRIQGKGTIVKGLPIDVEEDKAKSFHEAISEQGFQEHSEIVSFQCVDDLRARAVFGIRSEGYAKITRLRYINRIPVVLVKSITEMEVGEKILEKSKGNPQISFYELFETIAKEPVIKNELNVRIIQEIDLEDANLLKVRSNLANFYITSISYLKSGRPIEIVNAIFRGDLISIHANNSNFYVNEQALK